MKKNIASPVGGFVLGLVSWAVFMIIPSVKENLGERLAILGFWGDGVGAIYLYMWSSSLRMEGVKRLGQYRFMTGYLLPAGVLSVALYLLSDHIDIHAVVRNICIGVFLLGFCSAAFLLIKSRAEKE